MDSGYSDIKYVLYNLKRQFPATIHLVFQDSEVMNWTTGVETPTETTKLIKSAILLPSMFSTMNPITGSPFKDSGGLEIGERVLVIDVEDVKSTGLTIDKASKVLMAGERWDIVKLSDLNHAGYILIIREIRGSQNVT
jgi:hypothetical protein